MLGGAQAPFLAVSERQVKHLTFAEADKLIGAHNAETRVLQFQHVNANLAASHANA
jgi:hypothetical protein